MSGLQPSNTVIVVSCYKRSTEWASRLEELGFEVRRYTKEDPSSPYNIEKNAGMEASAYLKYCMNFYESLPEYTIFLHDEEFSWHHEGSIIDRIKENIGWSGIYKNINNHYLPYYYGTYTQNFKSTYDKFLKEFCGSLESYGEFMGANLGAAQMIVNRSTILARPYEMYEKLYWWLLSYDEIGAHKINGYFMEFTWIIIFQGIKPIDYNKIGRMFIYCKEQFEYISNYSYLGIDFYFGEDSPISSEYKWGVYLEYPLPEFNVDMFYTFFLEDLQKDSTCDMYDIDGILVKRLMKLDISNESI